MKHPAAPRARAADPTPSTGPAAPPSLPRRVQWLWSAAVALSLAVSACGGGGGGDGGSPTSTPAGGGEASPAPAPAPAPAAPAPAPEADARVVVFRDGLHHPWGLAFLPDGSMLVTERDRKQLRRVSADGATLSAPITAGLPAIYVGGQAGLLDVALDPDFASNRRIYLSYVEGDDDANGLAVWRAELAANFGGLLNGTRIWRSNEPAPGQGNYGGRLLFDRSGQLFVSVGDRLNDPIREQAQNPGSTLGKVVRITTGGAPAPGNPSISGGVPGLWSLGHRNTQGLALHPATGELWEAEHGPQGGDEINVVLPQRNYGWPLVSFGCEYNTPPETCTVVGGTSSRSDLEPPLTHWTPSIAPAGIAFYTGDEFPGWRGSLFVTALADRSLWRLTLDGNTVTDRERLFRDQGKRLRDVRQGPDGRLYLLTDEDDGQILRIQR